MKDLSRRLYKIQGSRLKSQGCDSSSLILDPSLFLASVLRYRRMSFEKPFMGGPAKVEEAVPPLEIPNRFILNPDPNVQEDLRQALDGSNEQLDAEKFNQGRLPSLELRYRKAILKYLLQYGAIDLDDLRESLEEEHIAIKEQPYQRALEMVYRLNDVKESASGQEGQQADEDEW
jgi:hypothetical protein